MTASEARHDYQMQVAARNQALFREVNERLEDLNHAFDPLLPRGEFVCECANQKCVERIGLSIAEYEAVRENGAHFCVVASDEHVYPGVERVVARYEHYWVVEMIDTAGRLAQNSDPRTRPIHVRT